MSGSDRPVVGDLVFEMDDDTAKISVDEEESMDIDDDATKIGW